MDGTVVLQQSDIVFIVGVVLFALIVVAVGSLILAATVIFRASRPDVGGAFQAPMDFLGEGYGLPGSVGTESGENAFQAPAGAEAPPTEAEARVMREYREAMAVVDRQVERATRQVLTGKTGQSPKPVWLDHEFFSGPVQAPAPGVKDE